MLAVLCSSCKGVELGAAEAGRDIAPHRLPLRMGRDRISVSSKRFEDVFTEGFEVGDLGGVGCADALQDIMRTITKTMTITVFL